MSDEPREKGPADAPLPLRPIQYSPEGLERLRKLHEAGAKAVERMQRELEQTQNEPPPTKRQEQP